MAAIRKELGNIGLVSHGYVQDRGPGAGGPCYQWTRKVKAKTVSVALSKEQFAANVADACASMSVTENSALDLAAGASLTLDDAITVDTDKKLNITAADGAKVKVNGTLDAATLSRIRLNGRRVMQSADGYLGIPGFMLIIQ